MASIKLKTGRTLELPFQEALEFIAKNPDLVEDQLSEIPVPKRRRNQQGCLA